jgi:hypothetical protein
VDLPEVLEDLAVLAAVPVASFVPVVLEDLAVEDELADLARTAKCGSSAGLLVGVLRSKPFGVSTNSGRVWWRCHEVGPIQFGSSVTFQLAGWLVAEPLSPAPMHRKRMPLMTPKARIECECIPPSLVTA